MGRKQKQKGDRGEREVVNRFQDFGVPAQRVPLSGASGGLFAGDVIAEIGNKSWRLECKWRAKGFSLVYRYLGDHDALILRRDHSKPLVVMPLDHFLNTITELNHEHSTDVTDLGEENGLAMSETDCDETGGSRG